MLVLNVFIEHERLKVETSTIHWKVKIYISKSMLMGKVHFRAHTNED